MRGDTLLCSLGKEKELLTRIAMVIHREQNTGKVKLTSSVRFIDFSNTEESEDIHDKIEYYNIAYKEIISENLAVLKEEMVALEEQIRTKESSFGNLVSDAMKSLFEADIGMINSGVFKEHTFEKDKVLSKKTFMSLCCLTAI